MYFRAAGALASASAGRHGRDRVSPSTTWVGSPAARIALARRTDVVAALVTAAAIVDREPVPRRAVQPRHQVADVGLVPGAVHPRRLTPFQRVALDGRVAAYRLCHQPPLVAGGALDLPPGPLMAGLGARGGVGVGADLGLEYLQARAVAGAEEVVEDPIALAGRVVGEQPRRAAGADRADALEGAAGVVAVDGDPLRAGVLGGARHRESPAGRPRRGAPPRHRRGRPRPRACATIRA